MVTCAHHRNCKCFVLYAKQRWFFNILFLDAKITLSRWFAFSNFCIDRLTFGTPRRPYERERLDQELRICGEFGLRCKREIWRVQLVLAKIRKVGEACLD